MDKKYDYSKDTNPLFSLGVVWLVSGHNSLIIPSAREMSRSQRAPFLHGPPSIQKGVLERVCSGRQDREWLKRL